MNIAPRKMRKARRAKRTATVASINLVSMIDIFVILVIYLLVNTAAVQVVGAEQVKLPKSISQEQPNPTVAVLVTDTDILVDGQPLMKVADARGTDVVIPQLQQRLLQSSTKSQPGPGGAPAVAEVNILADKNIPYSFLKKVMASCSAANFAKISLGVVPAGSHEQ